MANILDNAIKFTEQGTIKISTEVLEDSRITIEVHDTGAGISEKIMPRVFEKFASLSSVDPTKQGTGLGLFLAQKIVQAHKGAIWARNNEDGIGATVGFSLPRA
jgi:signal transduction histidine kinase